jgi:hypothetical protein
MLKTVKTNNRRYQFFFMSINPYLKKNIESFKQIILSY